MDQSCLLLRLVTVQSPMFNFFCFFVASRHADLPTLTVFDIGGQQPVTEVLKMQVNTVVFYL